MKTPKEVIITALNSYKGDDLEHAEMAFKNYTRDQLNKEYGQSGKTCRQVIDGLRKHREEVNNAIVWANTL